MLFITKIYNVPTLTSVNRKYLFWGKKIKGLKVMKSGFNTLPNDKLSDLLQIESLCRRQYKCDSKVDVCCRMSRKRCGKRRKCCLPAFSPFPHNVLKSFFSGVVRSRDCEVKS